MSSIQPDAGEDAPNTTNKATNSPHSAAPGVDIQTASLGEPEQGHKNDRTRDLEEQQDTLKHQLQKHKQKYRDLKQSHRELQQAHSDLKRAHQELSQEVFELEGDLSELKARFDAVVRS